MDRRFYAAILTIAILPIVALGYLNYRAVREGIESNTRTILALEAESKAKELALVLSGRLQSLKEVSALRIFDVATEYDRYEGVTRFFDSLIASERDYSGIVYLDLEGRVRAFSQYDARGEFVPDADKRWTERLARVHFLDERFGELPVDGGWDADARVRTALVLSEDVRSQNASHIGRIVVVLDPELLRQPLVDLTNKLRANLKVDARATLAFSAAGRWFAVGEAGPRAPAPDAVDFCQTHAAGGFSTRVCVAVGASAIYAESRRLELLFPLLLAFAILVIGGLMGLIVHTHLAFVRRIITKLEELALGDFKKVEVLGRGKTRHYLELVNSLVDRILAYQRRQDQTARLAAIGMTAQMLAHDVRRPFSIIKIALEALKRVKDPESMRDLTTRLQPEVERSMSVVNGMIVDVMQIGANSNLDLRDHCPRDLVARAIREIVTARGAKDVAIDSRLDYARLVHCDGDKLHRVLTNVIDNAFQATGEKGRIWIDVRQDPAAPHETLFVVGNSGSYISPADRTRVFDAFYSKGKRNGTGLGLAVAAKIVGDHGGRIWVESDRERGTELKLTLPTASAAVSATPAPLPKIDLDFALALPPETLASAGPADTAQDERVASIASTLGRPIRLLLVDDDTVYLESLKRLLPNDAARPIVEAVCVSSVAAALGAARAQEFDAVVCDIDLGDGGTGYDVVSVLKGRVPVCLHSSSNDPDLYRAVAYAGADAFVPKPMSRVHLMTFLADRVVVERAASSADAPASMPSMPSIPTCLLVEDNIFVQDAWKFGLGEERTRVFGLPSEVRRAVREGELALDGLAFAVLDFVFDAPGEETGVDLARWLRAMAPDLPMIACTDYPLAQVPGAVGENGIFDLVVDKRVRSYEDIINALAELRREPKRQTR